MLFLLTGFPQKIKLGDTHGTLTTLFCVNLISIHLQRVFSHHQKSKWTLPHQQVSGWNMLRLAWKKMVGYFSEIPQHTRISKSPD